MLLVDAFKRRWGMLTKPKETKQPEQLFWRVERKTAKKP